MPRVTSAHVTPRGPVLYADIRLADGERLQRTTGFRVGQEAEARAALEEVVREIEAGASAELAVGPWTVRRWGAKWNAERKAAGKLAWKQEATHLKLHLYPLLGSRPLREVTKADMLTWARELPTHERQDEKGDGPIAPRTVHNVANTVRAVFRAAAKRDLVDVSPCVWDAADLPHRDERRDVDRLEGGLDAEHVAALLTNRKVPEERRMLYALELLTGMRTGEAAIRRWRDWRPDEKPLGMLVAASAWSTDHHLEKPTKTRAVKLLPVHPFLARALRDWQARGWRRTFGRAPGPDDIIVPAARGGARNAGYSWHCWAADLERLGLERQVHYETRSTFRSLALAGGADLVALDLITHPSPRQARDLYNRRRLLWPKMCEAVEAVRLPLSPPKAVRRTASRGARRPR